MTRFLPAWLSVTVIIAAVFGAFWLLGSAQQGPDGFPGVALSDKHIVAPDFKGITVDGKPFHLADLGGKVVLINLWATWCGPCKMEIPDLIALQKRYAGRNFTIVGLADDKLQPVKDYVDRAGINYPVIIGSPEVISAYNSGGLPTSVLIGKDGKMICAMQGVDPSQRVEAMWAKQIDRAL